MPCFVQCWEKNNKKKSKLPDNALERKILASMQDCFIPKKVSWMFTLYQRFCVRNVILLEVKYCQHFVQNDQCTQPGNRSQNGRRKKTSRSAASQMILRKKKKKTFVLDSKDSQDLPKKFLDTSLT